MSLKENDVIVEDLREWKGTQPSIEHDLHKERNSNCDICEKLACEHGTLYENTCSLCWEKAKEDNDLAVFEDLHQEGIL